MNCKKIFDKRVKPTGERIYVHIHSYNRPKKLYFNGWINGFKIYIGV